MSYGNNFRAPRVDVHKFAMVPRASIPRSSFRVQTQHKTTLDAAFLYPVFLQEVLPGDSYNCQMTAFVRMATPLFPIMDTIMMESFFFFVPNRILWTHWVNMMGEQNNPADSISFSVPQIVSPVGGFARNNIYDYFGIPCTGQIAGGNTISINALPLRAYNAIWNQWFRDQNLDNSQPIHTDDGPDPNSDYILMQVRKRHDYYTSCLPWPQKGAQGAIPIIAPNTATSTLAPGATVRTYGTGNMVTGAQSAMNAFLTTGALPGAAHALGWNTSGNVGDTTTAVTMGTTIYPANLYADLSTMGSNTINSLRLAFQTQRLLERDARGGTRYQELLMAHFGVRPPDYRVQRPEYLGGGKSPVNMTPVPQTAQTGLTGGTTPLGTLASIGTAVGRNHGFRQSFTEHGYILGLVAFRADQIYQQGLRKLWSRSTRYDFYWPVFANLGEQAVLNKEIFQDGSANDNNVFGYQERWGELRYMPSLTTGYFNSKATTPLDAWHLAVKLAILPPLSSAWIAEPLAGTLQRCVAAGASAANQMFLCDFFFDMKLARALPMYSVPGMADHM